jgi:FixJ family two-component response regulator
VAVVEDDAPARVALGRVLRAGGFEPALFASAEAFIDARLERNPACLILDIQLEGMSGIDLQHRLRAAGSAIPIILTTALRDDSLRDRAEQTGCTAFFWKPFSAAAVLGVIAEISTNRNAEPKGDCTKVQ